MAVIGLDIGTTSTKGILINNEKQIITATRNYPIEILNNNWTQQNPEDWYEASISIIKELLGQTKEEVTDISFSGQMHGLVILDKDDNVIRPAILWNDQRTVQEVEMINNDLGIETLREEVGNIALTGYTLPKILWLKNNEKASFDKITKVMLPKDYVSYKLTGVFASDVSDLSGTLLFDVKNRKYSNLLIEYSGLKIQNLPAIYEANEVVAPLRESLKEELKIANEINIIIGGGDQAIGAIGTGTIDSSKANISLGTSGVVFIAEESYSLTKNPINHHFCDANNKYHKMGVALNTGASMKWFYEDILKQNNYEGLSKELSKSKFNDIIFLPYLNGERSPINDPDATGSFTNLRMNTKQQDMLRAVIEGTCFSLKHIFDELEATNIKKLRITGGGSKNDFWVQTIANVFNLEVETINIEIGPALGAGLIALANSRKCNVEDIIEDVIKVDKVIMPETDLVEKYQDKFLMYKNTFLALKEISN